jgi:hypothetical protein
MKNWMKLTVIAVMVLLLGSTTYAGKECKGKEAKKAECKAKDANTPSEKKECPFKKTFDKDHQQQLKALDEKAAKTKAKGDEKIASLEKELAEAKVANDTKKAEKIEKKIADTKAKLEKDMKKIEAKRAKIEAEAAKK